jgi:transcriptional pleiotropic regulator of transition state genes
MKSTGMTRPIDNLGRIVIPMELRKTMDLKSTDTMEIFTDADTIILRKYVRGCEFCGGSHELKPFGGKEICGHCREDIRKVLR